MREDQVVCRECHGVGEVPSRWDSIPVEMCGKCLGTGKVDWIENVVGKKYIEFEIEEISFPR